MYGTVFSVCILCVLYTILCKSKFCYAEKEEEEKAKKMDMNWFVCQIFYILLPIADLLFVYYFA